LDEWNIIKPSVAVAVTATGVSPKEKKAPLTEAAKATENATQRTLF